MSEFDDMSDSELRDYIVDNKDVLIEEITQSGILFKKFDRNYRSSKYVWDVANEVDKQSREEKGQSAQPRYTDEQLALRAKTQAHKSFNDRFDPNHPATLKAWQGTYTEQQDNGEGNNNGE